jgi:hypothetical protein
VAIVKKIQNLSKSTVTMLFRLCYILDQQDEKVGHNKHFWCHGICKKKRVWIHLFCCEAGLSLYAVTPNNIFPPPNLVRLGVLSTTCGEITDIE